MTTGAPPHKQQLHRIPGDPAERSKWLEGGWITYLKILQTSLSKWVSKTNSEANLALAQLSYASHLYKTSTRLNTKAQQQEKASYTPKQED